MQLDLDICPPRQVVIGGGLEGAERTTRETMIWDAPIISPDRQINRVKEEADARGRDSVQNDGFATGAVQTHRDSIVGAQYRLNAQPVPSMLGTDEDWAEEFQIEIESRFNLIGESNDCWFDASRKMTLTDMIRLAVGGFCYTGEVIATAEWIRQQNRPYSTAIQLISPSRLCNPDMRQDTATLRRGVERDTFGEAIRYWFRKTHPTDHWIDPANSNVWVPVDARKPWGRRQVIHIIEALQPDQTRGIADMVSVLKDMKMTRRFKDVVLQNAVVNATYAAAVESELPKELVFAQMGAGQGGFGQALAEYMAGLSAYVEASQNIAIDGVKMPHLYPGTKLNLKPMGTPGGVGTDFESSLHRHIAAGLGLSYEEFSRDFTQTNYSSARASMGQTWKYMQSRKKTVADKLATSIYHLAIEEDINAKRLPLPPGFTIDTFYNDPFKREALLCCDWIGAPRGQIDEMKETQAAILRIKAGLSTWEIEAGRLGVDWRKLYKQQARERKMMKDLGLDFALDATQPGKNAAKNTMGGQGGAGNA